jgi:hypothetical protein
MKPKAILSVPFFAFFFFAEGFNPSVVQDLLQGEPLCQ